MEGSVSMNLPSQIIQDYLTSRDIPVGDFAYKIRVSTSAVYRWLNGQCGISIKMAKRIERKTKGVLTVEMLCGKPKELL
jgi:plasmid maintenance system antidote protein VapI